MGEEVTHLKGKRHTPSKSCGSSVRPIGCRLRGPMSTRSAGTWRSRFRPISVGGRSSRQCGLTDAVHDVRRQLAPGVNRPGFHAGTGNFPGSVHSLALDAISPESQAARGAHQDRRWMPARGWCDRIPSRSSVVRTQYLHESRCGIAGVPGSPDVLCEYRDVLLD